MLVPVIRHQGGNSRPHRDVGNRTMSPQSRGYPAQLQYAYVILACRPFQDCTPLHLLVRGQDLKTGHTVNQGNDNKRACTGPDEANSSLGNLYPKLLHVAVKENTACNVDLAVRRDLLLRKQSGADGRRNTSYAVRGKGIGVVNPPPAPCPVGELDTESLTTEHRADNAKEE